jgi:hypothetical protein
MLESTILQSGTQNLATGLISVRWLEVGRVFHNIRFPAFYSPWFYPTESGNEPLRIPVISVFYQNYSNELRTQVTAIGRVVGGGGKFVGSDSRSVDVLQRGYIHNGCT